MGTHTNDDSVFREFQRSLKQKQPDFLFAHFMLERNKKALDSTDKGGWTTFMHACKKGNMEVLKWLHHRGADVHKSDKHNHTALHIAVAQKQYACVEWLVDVAKLDVNAKNVYGATPGHWAAQNGDYKLLEWFNTRGADLRACTIGHWRPEDYAERVPYGGRVGKMVNGKMVVSGSNKKHKKCIKYLRTSCADHPGKGKYLIPAKKEDIAKNREEALRRRAAVYKLDQERNFQKQRKYPEPLFQDDDKSDTSSTFSNEDWKTMHMLSPFAREKERKQQVSSLRSKNNNQEENN